MRGSRSAPYGHGDFRVLALLPGTADAGTIPRMLEQVGVASSLYTTPEEICAEIDHGAGTLIIQEEALSERTTEQLVKALDQQPPWSEIPIIVLLRRGPETRTGRQALLLPGDVTLIERPVRASTLVAIIQSALRSRRRQYLVRDYLQALSESETRYRTLFDSIDEGFCVIQVIFNSELKPVDYLFLETNPSFEKHTGLANAEGRRMRELAPGLEARWFDLYGRVALTGEPVRFEERAEQLKRWFDTYAFRVGLAENRQVAVLFTDITSRKNAEAQLQQANDQLEARVGERTKELSSALAKLERETSARLQVAEELHRKEEMLMRQGRMAALGEMMGFIAHQWKQPLNTLGLVLQEQSYRFQTGRLDQESFDSNTAAAMRLITQMSRTVDDFRNFFRPDKERVSFKIADILASTVKLMEPTLHDAGMDIEVQAAEDVTAVGFPNEFSQALLNILMNARDVVLERKVAQPKVAIRVFMEGDKAVTIVADNAGGIPEEIVDKIFDPYFSTKGPERGTGIGLYMAKIIIEKNMKGRVYARNTGNGAEFRIEVEGGPGSPSSNGSAKVDK